MWDDVSRALGRPGVAAGWRILKYWEGEFEGVIRRAGVRNLLKPNTHVFAPFSGGDALTALAVNPAALEYVLVDRWSALPPATEGLEAPWPEMLLTEWNSSRIADVAASVAQILDESHAGGYQFGYLVEAFGRRHGMLALILGALGTRTDLHVLEVKGVDGDVHLKVHSTRRKRPYQSFTLRYVTGDMHDAAFAARLHHVVATNDTRVVTLLKGTELALRPLNLSAAQLLASKSSSSSAPDDDANAQVAASILNASRARDAAAARAVEAILDLSRVVVQDVTGVPFRRLARWATVTHLFGTYAVPTTANGGGGPADDAGDAAALAAAYHSHGATIGAAQHALGGLRFGYCVDVDTARVAAGDATLRATADALRENGPPDESPRAAFGAASSSALARAPRAANTTVDSYCHMILACRGCAPHAKGNNESTASRLGEEPLDEEARRRRRRNLGGAVTRNLVGRRQRGRRRRWFS